MDMLLRGGFGFAVWRSGSYPPAHQALAHRAWRRSRRRLAGFGDGRRGEHGGVRAVGRAFGWRFSGGAARGMAALPRLGSAFAGCMLPGAA